MDDFCNNLQSEYDELLALIEKHLPIIWTNLIVEADKTNIKPNETDFNKLGMLIFLFIFIISLINRFFI